MLDRARNAAGNIELWPYRGAGLSHLVIMIDKACINRCPRSACFAAQHLRQLLNKQEIIFTTEPCPASDNNFSCLEVNLLFCVALVNDFCDQIRGMKLRRYLNELAARTCLR